MVSEIHPTAVVDPDARLAPGVRVGAYAVVGRGVEIGPDCELQSGAQIQGPTVLGRGNRVFSYACIGFEPQDLKFGNEETRLEIGDGNTFREFCTVHRGTGGGGGLTSIGNGNLLMAYSHVAHDCTVGSRTIFSNAATLAGHVEVHDDAVIGAFSAVHQFCRVGRHAYIGGFSVVTMDALPFVKTVGAKPACFGINRIGLQRKGFDAERLDRLAGAIKELTASGRNTAQALEGLREAAEGCPDIAYLLEFVESSKRGVIRRRPGGPSSRGARG